MNSLKILFIGNSKTYRQNFPKIFQNLVNKSGRNVVAETLVKPGASLLELYKIPESIDKIKSNKWDYVVLQERTVKALQDDTTEFEQGVDNFYKVIIQNNPKTKIIFNAVWVSNNYDEKEQEKTNEHYKIQALRTNGILSYSGNAFLKFHKNFPDIDLYEDQKHPSLAGAYLSACCLYSTIFKSNSQEIQYYDLLNPEIAINLQKISDEII